MSDDRLAQARAEAERRWFPGHDHEDCLKCGIDKQVREGFELGVEWADAHPYSTPEALVAAYEEGQRDAVEKGLDRTQAITETIGEP